MVLWSPVGKRQPAVWVWVWLDGLKGLGTPSSYFPFHPNPCFMPVAVSTHALSCTILSASVFITSQITHPLWSAPTALNTGLRGHWNGQGPSEHGQHRHSSLGRKMGEHLAAGDTNPIMAHPGLFRLFFNILELHLIPIRLVQHHLSQLELHCILSHYSSEHSPKLCTALKSQLSAFVCLDL